VGDSSRMRSARVERRGIGRVGVLDGDRSRPPCVGEHDEPVVGLDHRGDVLVGVSAHMKQRHSRRDLKSIRVTGGPEVALIDRPVVMEAGGGEERCIQGVIRMMVGEDNVGHVLGADAKHGKWVQDGLRAWHQSRVHDDDCVPIANKSNGGGHAMVQVALEQDVDLSHRLRIRMSMPRRRLVSGPLSA
jgi:hypothetical protein